MHPSPSPTATGLADFLGEAPWFRALPDELRALVRRTAVDRSVDAGAFVARVGEPSLHWFGVIRGCLQMYVVGPAGTETTLYCLRQGDWGGDGSLLKREIRRYDLRALTDARLCLVPLETFDALRHASIPFNHFLCDIMNARMGEFVGMLAAARLLGPEIQVARAILMLTRRELGDVQELSVAQRELALISGLSRQRVNVAIGVFKQQGLVRSEPRRDTLVIDVPRLRGFVTDAE